MNVLIDTQILSAQFKGIDSSSTGSEAISSITVNEFLWVYQEGINKPNYYIFHPTYFGGSYLSEEPIPVPENFKDKKWAKGGAKRTDKTIIDFNNQFPAYKEYGLEAVAEIINERKLNIFDISIAHVEKKKRKYLRERARFIINSGYLCIPPNQTITSIAMELFSTFSERYNCKKNLRNTINDLIILATAFEKEMFLVSKDSLLNRFAAKECGATLKEVRGKLEIDFGVPQCIEKKSNSDSKGYINRGWSYSIRSGNSVSGG